MRKELLKLHNMLRKEHSKVWTPETGQQCIKECPMCLLEKLIKESKDD